MKYERILRYAATTPLALLPSKWAEIASVLIFRASGHEFTPEEIAARLGDERGGSGPASTGTIAVIPIRGVIANRMGTMDESSGGVSAERIGAMLSAVAEQPSVKTILFDIDSPGGTVPGVPELAAQMFAVRESGKRLVAHVNDCACSAAYWLAAQCDEIVSVPSGTVGSIGVFCAHNDLSAALEKEGVKVTLISAGKFKTAGNPFEPLSDEERAVVQARVDDAYGQFVKDVARGRGVTPADVRNGYGEGRALSAKEAKAAGMIDRIATMEDTIARLSGRSRAGMRAEVDAEDALHAEALAPQEDAATRRLRLL